MSERREQRRLAAIVSADVAGYSRLMGRDESGTLASLKSHRSELIDPKIAEFGGRIVKTMGDGLLLEFASAVEAVQCAIDVQRGMAERVATDPEDQRMVFRIGVNLGEVIVEGDDIFGDSVNVASRLETLAAQGGICISRTVYDQIVGKISQPIEDMGDQALKNIEDPLHVYQIQPQPMASQAGGREPLAPDTTAFEFEQRGRPSIAILPFENLSGDPAQDYVAQGLRLGILTSLVQLSGLFLIGTRAVNRYREQNVPAAQAGNEVGVRYVLEGGVQQTGDRVRATLQLTDAQAGEVIWAERYDREFDDLLKMQDEITQEVIISLDIRLLGRESDRIWYGKLSSPKARECFLRGISHLYAGTKGDNAAARRLFEELYREQPDTVSGPSMVALTYWFDGFFGWTDTAARSNEQAAQWARKAIEYDDNNGLGYAILGNLQLFEGKHDDALENCRVAVQLRSSCPLAHGLLASAWKYCGSPQAAIQSARNALEIERIIYPPWLVNILATAYRDSGKVGLSIPAGKEAIRLSPEQTEARVTLCSDYMLQNQRDQARRTAGEIVSIDPSFRLSAYAKTQPYRDTSTLDRLIGVLRDAGLPD